MRKTDCFLEGGGINLRPFRKTDIHVWYEWFNSQETTEHMNKGLFPNTEVAQEDFFHSMTRSKNDIQLAIVHKDGDSLVGTIGIHKIDWIHRHGDVSIMIGDKSMCGKGVGSEAVSLIVEHAFTKLNLQKLTSGMWSSNISSRKCFEKNGFVLEGTLKKQFHYKGAYVDEIRLGLLREEWEISKGL